MLKRRYSYVVLRYVHDPLTAEFANVGVVMFCPAISSVPPLLKVRTRRTIGRMRDMFPDLDRSAFLSAMRALDRMFERKAASLTKESLFITDGNAAQIAEQILPRDDSSLTWSPVGGGLSDKPDATFERLFERFVSRYDPQQTARRTDEEIWKPVRQKLAERQLAVELDSKTIFGGDDSIQFQHAWKNGIWHVYEPISLDLADADGIYRKAHRWLGQLTSVAPEASERFQPYFLVGAPSDPSLQNAYQRALKILKKSPIEVEIFEEKESDKLVDLIEDEVRSHQNM